MESNAKQNQDLDSRHLPKDPNQELYMNSEGFPSYNNHSMYDSSNEYNKNTEPQNNGNGSVQNPEPNPEKPNTGEHPDYQDEEDDDNDLEKDNDIEEENPDNEDYPEEDENPDKQKKYYLRTSEKKYSVFFDLNFF